jgi:MFS family permease
MHARAFSLSPSLHAPAHTWLTIQFFLAPEGLMDQALAAANSSANSTDDCSGSEPSARVVEVTMRDAFPREDLPTFNLATNLVGIFSATGILVANQCVPRWSNTYGRTPFLMMNFGLGAIVYVGMFFVATTARSYWGYCMMMFLQGFFAGSMTLATTYFTDIYDSEEDRTKWSSTMMGVFLVLGAGGALLADPFKTIGLFHACWLGVACELIALVITLFKIPESHMPVAEAKLLSGYMVLLGRFFCFCRFGRGWVWSARV